MQCPRCQHENSPKAKFCGECGTPLARPNPGGPPAGSYTDLQREVEHLASALSEALEQQTATSEILRVISRSPTDLQPVLDTVVKSAARFCGAYDAVLFRLDGGTLRLAAHHGPLRAPPGLLVPLVRGSVGGRSVLERRAVHAADVQAEAEEFPESSAFAHDLGIRNILAAPLLREGEAIGTIQLRRLEVNPFTDKQIALLQTFADQAVIAIENVRLFKELEARNRELTESLEQQTATSEILKAISQSPTDIQPVLDAVAANAARVCGATDALILQVEGADMRRVAHFGSIPLVLPQVRPVTDRSVGGRAILDCHAIHVHDILDSDVARAYPESAVSADAVWRTTLAVPLVREGVAIGAITIRRTEVRPFTDKQIKLLETFADQAVIAIENVRLFTELQGKNRALTQAHAQVTEALAQQTATAEILRVISSSPTDIQPVFDSIVQSANRLCDGLFSALVRYDGELMHFIAHANFNPEALGVAQRAYPRPPTADVAVGRAILERAVVHIPDVAQAPAQTFQRSLGFQSVLAVPMLGDGRPIGAIAVTREEPGAFGDAHITLLRTFADQAVIAIENVRLFRELEAANRELGAASRHKSEFLANMSHELRTPLNAVIGFSEVLLQRMFGALNEKQDEYLKDIYASGQHLLSLINDILDLSKIEAGRMELTPASFHLPSALENAVALVRERAARHGIALHLDLDPGLGELMGDERKVKQVLLNLLSNAVKFTPEGGRITVKAGRTDGAVEIAVSDTGIGIAPEDQAAIFEEFRQVGTDDARKLEGTGLGLTLAKKFVELHDGRMWVESELGRGSTFTFTLPVS